MSAVRDFVGALPFPRAGIEGRPAIGNVVIGCNPTSSWRPRVGCVRARGGVRRLRVVSRRRIFQVGRGRCDRPQDPCAGRPGPRHGSAPHVDRDHRSNQQHGRHRPGGPQPWSGCGYALCHQPVHGGRPVRHGRRRGWRRFRQCKAWGWSLGFGRRQSGCGWGIAFQRNPHGGAPGAACPSTRLQVLERNFIDGGAAWTGQAHGGTTIRGPGISAMCPVRRKELRPEHATSRRAEAK
jgi:hypothetical protein